MLCFVSARLDDELLQDSLLHVRRSGHGGVEDNILHFSFVDALDEPLGALWRGFRETLVWQKVEMIIFLLLRWSIVRSRLSSYTPPLKRGRLARSFRGIALPKPQAGCELSSEGGCVRTQSMGSISVSLQNYGAALFKVLYAWLFGGVLSLLHLFGVLGRAVRQAWKL